MVRTLTVVGRVIRMLAVKLSALGFCSRNSLEETADCYLNSKSAYCERDAAKRVWYDTEDFRDIRELEIRAIRGKDLHKILVIRRYYRLLVVGVFPDPKV